jgi:hypothetical protein
LFCERNRSRNRGSLGFWLAGENGEEIALLERDRRERENGGDLFWLGGGWDEGILLELEIEIRCFWLETRN